MNLKGPLIVQSDYTLMLEVEHPQYADCRDFLAPLAELLKSPEFIHTYRITPLSLWNAAALEIPLNEILAGLHYFSRYEIPPHVLGDIQEWYNTYGKLTLEKDKPGYLRLTITEPKIQARLLHEETVQCFWKKRIKEGFLLDEDNRGEIKQALIKLGYPARDICGYASGNSFSLSLRSVDLNNNPFELREYQTDAVHSFYHGGRETGGSGVVVMPCGSGKTIVGLAVISLISNYTLIITTNNVAAHQWRDELISKTTVSNEDIGEFTGMDKQIKPVTVTTYQMLTYRRSQEEPFENLRIFNNYNWGLIVYDEVHLLPAPVFRATSKVQAKRRLGLTATLVREDGKEDDVFALIGPKRYDVPWKVLERKGYIAKAYCTEYRVPLPAKVERKYAVADKREQFRIAAENPAKDVLVQELLENHRQDSILIIGQFISQLQKLAKSLDLPLITGKMPHAEREALYHDFRDGKIPVLVVSKVANFAVDLPDANIMIQISGTYGSRQEEAQRLGRILRPKQKHTHFYTLVSHGTNEQEFGNKRQLFLVEQGYKYEIRYFKGAKI